MMSGSSISANLVPLVGTFDLGYLFSSFPQQTKAFDAGAAKPIEDALLKGANIRIIAWAYNFGSRSVLAKKPVKTPEDLAGLKIRTLPNPVITECLRLMGAAATPLAFGEIYTALQAGVLDGLEHDPPTILASKFFETAKFYALTQHNFSPLAIYFSDVTFNRMDPKLREGFLDCRQEGRGRHARARARGRKGSADDSRPRRASPWSNATSEAFRKRVAPQTENFIKARPEVQARHRHHPRDAGLRLSKSDGDSRRARAERRPRDHPLLLPPQRRDRGDPAGRRPRWSSAPRCCCASCFNAPVEWSDDVARGLMVGSSFFGAASALARGENLGVAFFIDHAAGAAAQARGRCRGRAAGD